MISRKAALSYRRLTVGVINNTEYEGVKLDRVS